MPEPTPLSEALREWMEANWPAHREHIHINLQGELIRNPCDTCGHARSLHDHTGECPFCLGCDEETP